MSSWTGHACENRLSRRVTGMGRSSGLFRSGLAGQGRSILAGWLHPGRAGGGAASPQDHRGPKGMGRDLAPQLFSSHVVDCHLSLLFSSGDLFSIHGFLQQVSTTLSPILLIEEPENGIHPRAIETVMQSLSSVYGSQVFCATHSPLVLSTIQSRQLLCFGKTEEGAVDIVSGDHHPGLKNWKDTLHLGDLLAIGVLG